jgi:hypothetical protein
MNQIYSTNNLLLRNKHLFHVRGGNLLYSKRKWEPNVLNHSQSDDLGGYLKIAKGIVILH